MKEENLIVSLGIAICTIIGILGVIQLAQIIQWLWLNVSITIK
jgi:hypothetical protein